MGSTTRDEFEVHAVGERMWINRHGNGRYVHETTEAAWRTWVAATGLEQEKVRALAREVAEHVEFVEFAE